MKKEIMFGTHPVEINSSAGWLYVYREQFGHDILPDLMPIVESVINAIGSVVQESGGEVSNKTILDAMNNETLVDAFIKLAGMEVVTVYNILWAMAKNADDAVESPRRFFNEFETVPMDAVIPELFKTIIESSVSPKNAKSLLQNLSKFKRTSEE